MFVMVATVGFYLSKFRPTSLSGTPFPAMRRGIDKHLVIGSILFGIGWGIVGICPAPAIVLVGMGIWQGLVFFIAMLVGMGIMLAFDNAHNILTPIYPEQNNSTNSQR